MTQQPPSRLTRFRIFWEALDAVMARRGLPPPSFEQARDWFECELEPETVGEMLEARAPTELRTAAHVVEALGGSTAVSRLTGRKIQAVSNWKSFQRFPANTFIVMKEALRETGKDAPDWLWNMKARPPLDDHFFEERLTREADQ